MKKIFFVVLFLVSQVSVADWRLNDKVSALSFISTKNASVTEVHSFKELSGSVKDNGEAMLKIGLESVETNIPIRNDRMKQFLFETDRFKEAMVELKVDPAKIKELAVGEWVDMPVKAKLALHGVTQEIDAKLRVVKMQNNGIVVSTIEPVILSIDMFGLQSGLEKLKEIAKLGSITTTVPVALNLAFEAE
ncbi:MAG: YceI family protein [Gammaproteobacteria bacterium]